MSTDSFSFAEDFLADRLMLFEMPSEDVMQKVISGEIELEFVSNEKDPIVLCDASHTFEVLEFDTSNSLFVCDGSTIISKNSSTFELRDKPPPFLELRRVFHANPITEAEITGAPLQNPIFERDLIDSALCSKAELRDILFRLCAVVVDGAVKTMTPEMYRLIGGAIIQYGMTQAEWRRIRVSEFMDQLKLPMIESPIMRDLVLAVLRYLSSEVGGEEAVLDEKRVTWFVAEDVLRQTRRRLDVEEFKHEMLGRLPPGLALNLEYLHGMVVLRDNKVLYIDEEQLPLGLKDRLETLFRIAKGWEEHEMEPFFEFFATKSLPFSDLIQRYARLADGLWMHR